MPSDVLITPASSKVDFTDGSNATKTLRITGTAFSLNSNLNVLSSTSLGSAFKAEGVNGTLFEVTDDLSNSLMSVNTIGGLPIFEVFANNSIIAGQYNANDFVLTGNKIGIGTASPTGKLTIFQGNNPGITLFSNNAAQYAYLQIGRTSSELEIGVVSGSNQFFTGTVTADAVIKQNSAGKLHLGYGSAAPAVTIDSSNNIGVGTVSPTSKLTLVQSSGADSVLLELQSNNDPGIRFGRSTYGSLIRHVSATTDYIAFNCSGTSQPAISATAQIVFDENGNVGVGTLTPVNKIHIAGSASVGSSYNVAAPTNGLIVQGAVGIGTTVPVAKLQVSGAGIFASEFLNNSSDQIGWVNAKFTDYNDGHGIYISSLQAGGGKWLSGEGRYWNSGFWRSTSTSSTAISLDSGALKFYTNTGLTANSDFQPSERMRINSGGNVGIGTTTVSYKLHVQGDVYARSAVINISGDLNALRGNVTTMGYSLTNSPSGAGWITVNTSQNFLSSGDILSQLAYDNYNQQKLFTRYSADYGATWSAWKTIINSDALSGTTNYVPKFTGTNSIGNSLIFDNGTNVAVGSNAVAYGRLQISATGTSPSLSSTNPTDASLIISNSDIAYGTMFATYGDGKGALQQRRTNAATYYDFSLQPHGGNVGIGVASPRVLLDLAKANNVGQVLLLGETGANIRVGFGLNPSNAGMRIFSLNHISDGLIEFGGISSSDGSTWTRNHRLGLAGGNSFFNEQGGNVGIGTISPSGKLDIVTSGANLTTYDFGWDLKLTTASSWARSHRIYNTNYTAGTSFFGVLGGGSSVSYAYWTYGNPASIDATGYNTSNGIFLIPSGKVGIGVTSPTQKLDVVGNYGAAGDDTGILKIRGGATGGDTQLNFGVSADGGYGWIQATDVGITNNINIVLNPIGGNVGIGATVASAKLHVAGTTGLYQSAGSTYLYYDHSGVNTWRTGIFTDNTSSYIIGHDAGGTFATKILTITMGGNVGIGTTSPLSNLHLYGAAPTILTLSSTSYPSTYLTTLGVDAGARAFLIFGNNAENQVRAGRTTAGGYLDFYTNNTVGQTTLASDGNFVMRLTAGGNIGVGATTASNKLTVSGPVSIGSGYNTAAPTNGLIVEGSVGIGLTNPNYKLTVSTSSALGFSLVTNNSTTGGPQIDLYDSGRSEETVISSTDGTTVGSYIASYTNHPLLFGAYASVTPIAKMIIAQSGNVGIGTISTFARLHVNSTTSGATLLRTDGTNGTLFSVVDDLSDSLMSVNNSAGLPVLEVFADDRVVMGQYGANDFVLVNNKIGLGTNNPQYELDIVGAGTNAAVNIITRIRSSASSDTFNTGSVIAFTNTTTNVNAYSYVGSRIDLGGAGDNAQALIFATNATNTLPTEKMRIKSDGNVGINTATPVYKLDVNGTFNASGTATLAAVSITGTITTSATEAMRVNNNNGYISIYNSAGSTRTGYIQGLTGSSLTFAAENGAILQFNVGGTERARIDTSGNLGIGTTTAYTKTHIYGTLTVDAAGAAVNSFTEGIRLGAASNGYSIVTFGANAGASSGQITNQWWIGKHGGDNSFNINSQGGGDVFRILQGGNVGIGNTAPSYKLHVNGNGYFNSTLQVNSNITLSGGGDVIINDSDGTGSFNSFMDSGVGYIRIDDGGSANGTLNINSGTLFVGPSSGNVGVGTVTPSARLQVGTNSTAATADNSPIARFGGSGSGSRVYGLTLANTASAAISNDSSLSFIVAGNYSATGIISAVLRSTVTAATDLVFTNYNNALFERMRIQFDGNVGIGTSLPAALLQIGGLTPTSATGGLQFGDDTGTRLYRSASGVVTCSGTIAATFTGNLTGNASTATSATVVTGTNGQLLTKDVRTIAPNNIANGYFQFGFTSWTNNNNSPYADYLHLRSYTDSSGGNDNLVMFRKDAIGMRIYQAGFGTSVAYSSFKDVAFTDQSFFIGTTSIALNRASASQTLTGVSIDGNAANVSGTVAVANGGTGATTAANARTNLGATTVGANFFTLTNPSAITFPRINADNTVSALDAATFRTAIGAGTGSGNGTVTSVSGTGTVSGLTLSGTVTTTGNLTLGGTLSVAASNFASQTANTFLSAPNGAAGVPTFRAIVAADVPTLNQSTTGNAANVTGTVALANGGSGQTSAQAAMNAFAGAVTSGSYLRGNGTNVVMSAIQAADVPTLNQNTTGSSGSCTGNAATATNASQLGGAVAARYVRNDTDGTAGDLFSLVTVTKSLTVTTSWIDTGISAGSDLVSGAYILTLNVDNYAVSGGHYNETYTGIMYWYAGATNDAGYDEIPLHKSGHAPNTRYINLRTLRGVSGVLKLQIISSVATSGASNYIFKFRRMI